MNYQDAKEEIKNRISIVDIIKEYIPLKKSGSNYIGLCPFHADKNPSMSVNENRKIFKCFACNEGGDVFHFLEKYLGISYYEAVKRLAKVANIEIDNDFTSNENYKKIEAKKQKLYRLHKDIANIYYRLLHSDVGKEAYLYLKDTRHLSDETILKFGLGYAPNDNLEIYNKLKSLGYEDDIIFESTLFKLNESNNVVGYFFNRIIFPVVDINNNIIGFQSRTLDKEQKKFKYLNSKSTILFQKDSILYAYNFAFRSNSDYYIICEGNMDVISLYQSGFDNAVAAQGTSFNEKQIFLLKRKPKKIFLCQDTDDAGITAKNHVADMLMKHGFETYMIDLSPVKDVDEFINDKTLGVEELKKRLNNPIPSILYYVSTAKRNLNLNNPYDFEKYLNLIVEKLAGISNSIVRDNYIKQSAIQENIDANRLNDLVYTYLKGNQIKTTTYENTKNSDESFSIDLNNKTDKYESQFIYLSYMNPDFRSNIKNCVDINELNNSICKMLYQEYINGKNIDDLSEFIDGLDDSIKAKVNLIINNDYSYDENDKDKIIDTLNVLIRYIKINNIKNNNDKSLDSIYKSNQLIKEINDIKYI